jgi:5-methyltetrahydrofolate--homocysteine methyltransferase
MHDYCSLYRAILTGDAAAAADAARKLVEEGAPPMDLASGGITQAMSEVGRLFEAGEYFVPELLMAARATKDVFTILRPLLAQTDAPSKGRVILGTVRGDLHDIGKNLVAAMLEGAGFEITDLGVDVPPENFVAAIREVNAQIVGLSALLTSVLPAMKTTIEVFRKAGIRDKVHVMVGGAPVTKDYAESIGADGYADNATASVALASRLSGL